MASDLAHSQARPSAPALAEVIPIGSAQREARHPTGEPGQGHGGPIADRRVDLLWSDSFDALILVDDDRRYVRVNGPAAELLGAAPEEILGATIERFTPPELWPVLDQLWAQFERQGVLGGPYEVLRGDGGRSLIEFHAGREYAPGQHLIVAREVIGDLPPGGMGARDSGRPLLTPREREILQLAADGGTTSEIADILVVSPGTVKTHFEHVYAKLRARDRASAVAEGLRRGLIR